MRSKTYIRILLIVGIFGIVLSSIIIFFSWPIKDSYAELTPSAVKIKSNNQISQSIIDARLSALNNLMEFIVPGSQTALLIDSTEVGLPIRLIIPKIKVDTVLEQVGLTPQGAVDVPKGSNNAAWFDLSPRPGDGGNAVITGHYGVWRNGQSTVFNNLSKLVAGDKLYIEDEKGKIIIFVVRHSRSYNSKANVPEVFISSDGKSHLNLITCEGAWNKFAKSYSKRLVVFADKE